MSTPVFDALDALRTALAPHYEVERVLGVGGMGSVYLGRDTTLDRPVAVKVISRELSASAPFRERFLHEARIVARLRHANIVNVYAAGERDGLLYFVMEYVEGETLRDLLEREKRLSPARTATILCDIAQALAYAHAHDVIHRDLKPENILLEAETGRALLTDFGVAQAAAMPAPGSYTPDGRMTGTGIVLGSPRYMSPEQAAGERSLDGRSDIYALGLVGYEALAGEPVFGAASGPSLMAKHLTERPAGLVARAPGVPAPLAEVIERALEKSPDARWPDAASMAQALAEAGGVSGGHTPQGVYRPSPTSSYAAPRRWSARAKLLAAAAVVVLAIPATWFVFGRGGVPSGVDPRRSYLVAPFEVQGGDPRLAWLRDGAVSMLASDLAVWRDLKVVDYERSLDLLRNAGLEDDARIGLEAARRVAREAGVWTVVMGQVTGTTDSVIVVARAYDVASGSRVAQVQQSAAIAADPRPLFDRIARELLDLAGAPPLDPELSRRTTSSLEAYRAYLEGVRALNAWRLEAADSLLAHAASIDTTFALAYYKRALAIGWSNATDSSQVRAVQAAKRHGTRLPPRERDLIEAYSEIVQGLVTAARGDQTGAIAHLQEAQRRYDALVRQDSTDAEAWYGLGDAYFHGVPDQSQTARHWTLALRAFDRTTRLDSTFHLAYSHKINIYQAGSQRAGFVLVVGDSVIIFKDSLERNAFGPERVQRAVDEARLRAVREARHWVLVDPDAPQARMSLATSFVATGAIDSAVTVLRQAIERPGAHLPDYHFNLAALQAMLGDTAALTTLRIAVDSITPEEYRNHGSAGRFPVGGAAAGVATYFGDLQTSDSILRLVERSDPQPPQLGGLRASELTGMWRAMTRAALGIDVPRARREVEAGIARVEQMESPTARGVRAQLINAPYLAYYLWRDPKYLAMFRRWTAFPGDTVPELQALEALRRGDTASARRLAAVMVRPDTTQNISLGGLRKLARAEVQAELGLLEDAAYQYETLDPERFNAGPAPEPGWALTARSLPARAELYEQLGRREQAIAAYEEFLRLWGRADAALQPQVSAARAALARIKDAPAARPVR